MYHSILFSPTTTTRRKKICIFISITIDHNFARNLRNNIVSSRGGKEERDDVSRSQKDIWMIQTLQKIRAFPAVQRHVCVAILARPCKKTTKIGQQSNAKCLRRSRSFVCSKYVGSVQPIFIQTLLDGEWKRARSISRYSL